MCSLIQVVLEELASIDVDRLGELFERNKTKVRKKSVFLIEIGIELRQRMLLSEPVFWRQTYVF